MEERQACNRKATVRLLPACLNTPVPLTVILSKAKDLKHNPLTVIPSKAKDLKHNPLTVIPSKVKDLKHNPLTVIPSEAKDLKHINENGKERNNRT